MPVDKYIWGNCKRPGWLSIGSGDRKIDGISTPADRTCNYFEPRQTTNTRKSTSKEDTDAQKSTDSP